MDAQARTQRREHWRGVVDEWRRSGLAKAAFCRERGLVVWQFHYWCGRQAGNGDDQRNVFARVQAAGGSGVRLRLGGLEVEVEPGFDDGTLKRLLRVLGTAC